MRKKRVRPHPIRNSMKMVGILSVSFAIMAGCSATTAINRNPQTGDQVQTLKSVKVSIIKKQKIADPLEHAGVVQPSVQFDIVTKAAGDVGLILKKRGDMVQAGEVIAKLNSTDANFAKEKADLAVQAANDSLARAHEQAQKDKEDKKTELSNSIQKLERTLVDMTRNFNKARNEYDSGLVTKAQVDQAESQLNSTRMDLDQLKRKQDNPDTTTVSFSDLENQLKGAQIAQRQVDQSISNLQVTAPVSGILTDLPIELGMTLPQGSKAGQIQKLEAVKIIAQLNQDEFKVVNGKKELTYYLPGASERFKGSISYLAAVADPQSKTYELNLEVPNPGMSLKPGMKITLQLTSEEEQSGLTVPTYSIVQEGDQSFVFVLVGESVEKRKVQLGRSIDSDQEVLSGVKEGEMVVTSGQNQLKDKEKVLSASGISKK